MDLRPQTFEEHRTPDTAVVSWVERLGTGASALATVRAGDLAQRINVYRKVESHPSQVVLDKSQYCINWVDTSFSENLTRRIAVQKIIQTLVEAKDLNVDEPVREVIDRKGRNLHDPFIALWNARFCYEDGLSKQVEAHVRALTNWTLGKNLMSLEDKELLQVEVFPRSHFEQYDLVLLWLSLAGSNHHFDRIILPFDGLERAVGRETELLDLITRVQWWSEKGCPVGLMLGYSANTVLDQVLSWIRPRF